MQLAKHRVLATQSLSTVNLFANMAAGDLAPSTPAMSVDLTTEYDWDADPFGSAKSDRAACSQKFAEHAKTFLKQMLAQHGGVEQCLAERFQNKEARVEFLSWAKGECQEHPRLPHHDDLTCPRTPGQPGHVFSWQCSTSSQRNVLSLASMRPCAWVLVACAWA